MVRSIIKTVAENLERARKAAGGDGEPLSFERLGPRAGVAPNTIKNVEQPQASGSSGRLSGARIDNIAKIARAFGCEPWQFLVPGLDIHHKPVLATGDDAELLRRFHMLSDEAKAVFLESLPKVPPVNDGTLDASGRGPAVARKRPAA